MSALGKCRCGSVFTVTCDRKTYCSHACYNDSRRIAVSERLISRLDRKPGGCWEWTGVRDKRGYGRIPRRGRGSDKAHRIAWEVWRGPIPAGLHVRHTCDNPPCCNPDHLAVGTHADNMKDMADRRRGATPGAKLDEASVLRVREWVEGGMSQGQAAALVGVSPSNVSLIVNRKVWRHVGT